jgi:hypothetical protein
MWGRERALYPVHAAVCHPNHVMIRPPRFSPRHRTAHTRPDTARLRHGAATTITHTLRTLQVRPRPVNVSRRSAFYRWPCELS